MYVSLAPLGGADALVIAPVPADGSPPVAADGPHACCLVAGADATAAAGVSITVAYSLVTGARWPQF
jgi:hypothetical protein